MHSIVNVRIKDFFKLISPAEIRREVSVSDKAVENILEGRKYFCEVLHGDVNRFAVITGPCSIHDPEAAKEYAQKIKKLADQYGDKLLILMRVYFEKPRTTVGWKGLINDPNMDDSNDMGRGLKIARKLLNDINEMGVYTATELLDPIISAYMGELVSWVAVGARTTESQTHRQMASGLSAPVGFKNNSDGNLDVAVNAMKSAQSPHSFLGIDNEGRSCILSTAGNPDSHIVLRGGKGRPNYHMEDIEDCESRLQAAGFEPRIMVDCSHENSGKDYLKQGIVVRDILAQKKFGNKSIFGLMLESNLFAGNQKMASPKDLKYGVSITDACIGFDETEQLLREIYEVL